jgi:Oxidoreductase family, NAD-binding Rossmann fold
MNKHLEQVRAAVVGTRWGMVHVHALRAHGVQVLALAGRDAAETRAAAQREQIPHAVTDVAQLAALGINWVSVASPAASHAVVAAQLRKALGDDCAVFVEKPLLGAQGAVHDAQAFGPKTWVNYAMPFVSAARALTQALSRVKVRSVSIQTRHDLGHSMDLPNAVLDMASHPWSWVAHAIGTPTPASAHATAHGLHMRLGPLEVPCELRCTAKLGLNGLQHRVVVQTDQGVMELLALYERGKPWQISAWHRGEALPVEPHPTEKQVFHTLGFDPWLSANVRSVGQALRAAFEPGARQAVQAKGLFTPAQALALDQAVWAAMRQ